MMKELNQTEWKNLLKNMDTEEGRQEFISRVPSGIYSGKNEDGEEVITVVSQSFWNDNKD